MPSKPIRIATRGSALALAQARATLLECQRAFPERRFEIQVIKTTGDKLQTASLAGAQLPKGLFTKELETALLSKEADLAVHSLKDLPTQLPAGCILGAVGRREDPRDVMVVRAEGSTSFRSFGKDVELKNLPAGAVIATSSTRRAAQILEHRPDLRCAPIRGNVGTRLRKLLENPEIDATMLAAAGLNRLQFRLDDTGLLSGGPADMEPVPPGKLRVLHLSAEEMIPCVGQAAIGIEIREGDEELAEICRALHHDATGLCVMAERSFLQATGGGCQAAVAAHARLENDLLRIAAVSYLGNKPVRSKIHGPAAQAEELGRRLASLLL
ncbi:MAG: hydroxymethylbilane synthase [Verrucomicrobia bacterium]|nr:hydroxymethylbilane synthase [Verrucomicrobiota bacterium]